MGNTLGLLAFAIALTSATLWFRAAAAVRLPEDRTAFIASWFAALSLGMVALAHGTDWMGGSASVIAIAIGLFLCLTASVSAQKVGRDAIEVGLPIPEFSAPDENGDRFDSASLRGKPALIKFFRGHW